MPDRDFQIGQIITKDRLKRYAQAGLFMLAAAVGWVGAFLYYYWNLGNQNWKVRVLKLGVLTGLLALAAVTGIKWAFAY